MSDVFASEYADTYDLFYREKDYDAEVRLIERALERHHVKGRRVLDLGCGSGQHSVRLARRGFAVDGVDRSEAMLAHARARARPESSAPRFHAGDVRTVRLGATFDAVLMMFAVLGYQVSNADVRAALGTARVHLGAGGLFIADVWYGPAVLAVRPEERRREFHDGARTVTRVARATLDTLAQRADVQYEVRVADSGAKDVVFHETHAMRFFFAQELRLFLEDAGFELLELSAFGSESVPPTEESWNVLLIARAV